VLVITIIRTKGKNARYTAYSPLGREILTAIIQSHVMGSR
jgi:hypothetical protein